MSVTDTFILIELKKKRDINIALFSIHTLVNLKLTTND
jgi:hypothetical protein